MISEVTILSPITHKVPPFQEVKIKCPNNINSIIGKTATAFIVSRFTDFDRQNYTTIFKSDGAAQGNLSGIEVEEKLSGLQVEGDLKSGLTATLETPTCTDTGIYKCTIVYQYNATAEATMDEITPVNIICKVLLLQHHHHHPTPHNSSPISYNYTFASSCKFFII